MSEIGKPERATQNRVVKLFEDELGYDYLGNWEYGRDNSNIEGEYLEKYLQGCGYSSVQISKAIHALRAGGDWRKCPW